MRFTAIGLLILAKCTLEQNFSLSKPATGPSLACQGSDVTLQCLIERNGVPADLVWRRNRTFINTDVLTNHQIVFNSTFNANTDLVITNIGFEDDNTEYQCTVPNSGIILNSSIVLNVTGPPSIKDVSVDTSVCSVLVRWSTNRNEICGPITFNVTLINESSILVNQSPKNLSNLVPDTNYTLEVCAMDGAGRGMAFTRIFKTAIPKGEVLTASWDCADNTCRIFVNWTTTAESCSPIVNLGIHVVNAFTDAVNVTNGTTTTSYTALVTVNKLITNAVLIATYRSGDTRRSDLNPIARYSYRYLLHSPEGKIVFDENISVTAKWRGATNLGITYRVSVTCNDSYTEEKMVKDALTTNLIILQNTTADNIRCQLSVSIDVISLKINISLSESRGSMSSPSTDNDYCEDNPGVCIGVPVAVSLATVIVLVVVVLLFVYPTTRNMILILFHQTSKAKDFSETNATDNEYVTVTEETNTDDQPSSDSDAISLENTDLAEAVANETMKYTEVTLPENFPIHLPSNNLVSYAEIQQ